MSASTRRKEHKVRLPWIAGALLVAAMAAQAAWHARREQEMGRTAAAFLAALPPEQRARAALPFEHASRSDWHFVPRARPGVAMGALDAAGGQAARALLASGLSARGLRKLDGVLALEALLRELESTLERRATWRDPGAYHLSVFGDPLGAAPWGWRLEGHHLSFTFTGAGGEVAATPHFVGAHPAVVGVRGGKGLRVLGAEEDLALALAQSLDEEQRALAVRPGAPPADILFGPRSDPASIAPEGIEAARLTPAQRALLAQLLDEVLGALEPGLAARAHARLEEEGLDALRFLWIGALDTEAPHYWRVHGPRTVIELDDVQNGANHEHLLWRDLERDLGADLLRRHRSEEHGGR